MFASLVRGGAETKGIMNKWKIAVWMFILLSALSACQDAQTDQSLQPKQPAQQGAKPEMQVQSSAFSDGEPIPPRHTCDGADISPPLSWFEPPTGTQSLALTCDDPDAPGGTWDHWVLFNIPASVRSLSEGIPPDEVVAGVGMQGSNSWKRIGYGGPCPPKGSTHHYDFKLYALDRVLDLDPGASKRDLEKAMSGHILATGQLTGQYGR
jgi:Raf kinase inhibitor-like YbhB/YbcL family protein